ncbi:hypothetical protein ABBQ38_000665 [Trebouxia sp. C0009 RCD-2024]
MKELYNKALSSLSIASLRSTKRRRYHTSKEARKAAVLRWQQTSHGVLCKTVASGIPPPIQTLEDVALWCFYDAAQNMHHVCGQANGTSSMVCKMNM